MYRFSKIPRELPRDVRFLFCTMKSVDRYSRYPLDYGADYGNRNIYDADRALLDESGHGLDVPLSSKLSESLRSRSTSSHFGRNAPEPTLILCEIHSIPLRF